MVTCNDCIHCCVCPIADGCEYDDEQHIRDDCEYFAPTADVVPKSEVEATVEKLMSATDKVICEAKAEVAKEIFEEIEFEISQLDYDWGETKAIAIEGIIAELKKKYAESCTRCKHFVGCEQANWVRGCDEYEEGDHDGN